MANGFVTQGNYLKQYAATRLIPNTQKASHSFRISYNNDQETNWFKHTGCSAAVCRRSERFEPFPKYTQYGCTCGMGSETTGIHRDVRWLVVPHLSNTRLNICFSGLDIRCCHGNRVAVTNLFCCDHPVRIYMYYNNNNNNKIVVSLYQYIFSLNAFLF